MRRCSIKLVGLLSLLWMVTSCVKDAYVEPEPVADADMTLTLSFNTGTRAIGGDPGQDHGENTADWKNLGVYLVYEDGKILNFKFTNETFHSPKVFSVYPGKAKVFVVAFPEGQDVPACSDGAAVRNMKTLNVTDPSLEGKVSVYMKNIFSGVGTIEIKQDVHNSVTIVCKRLVAKVDMQYDVQAGVISGKFTEAAMSAVSFKGVPQAYVFPGVEHNDDTDPLPEKPELKEVMNLGAAISERNGRAYAYMFPGESGMDFTVTYTLNNSEGEEMSSPNEVIYNTTFDSSLSANAWYKVNFTVSGANVSATSSVDVTIKNNTTSVR